MHRKQNYIGFLYLKYLVNEHFFVRVWGIEIMKFTWWILSDVLILNFWFLMWRYELCFTGEKMVKVTQASQVHEETYKFHNHHPHSSKGEKHDSDNVLIDVFRWSRCKKPLPQKVMQSVGIPLPLEHVEVLHFNFFPWNISSYLDVEVWHIFSKSNKETAEETHIASL
jgi:hypothetical protein